jgi:ParB family chromosome partitioning protein
MGKENQAALKEDSLRKEEIRHLPIDCLERCRYQPRQTFKREALEELAASIASQGVIQPIEVRPTGSGKFEIISGERRWRASQLAAKQTMPCIVRHGLSEEQVALHCVMENDQREDLNPIERATSYQELIDLFGYTHEQLAKVVSKKRTEITNLLRLLTLDSQVQKMIVNGALSEGHGKALAGQPQHLQLQLARQTEAKQWSVRELESAIKKINRSSRPGKKNPDVLSLERRVSEHFGAQTDIEFDQATGQVNMTIRCFSVDEFNFFLKRSGVPSSD